MKYIYDTLGSTYFTDVLNEANLKKIIDNQSTCPEEVEFTLFYMINPTLKYGDINLVDRVLDN